MQRSTYKELLVYRAWATYGVNAKENKKLPCKILIDHGRSFTFFHSMKAILKGPKRLTSTTFAEVGVRFA